MQKIFTFDQAPTGGRFQRWLEFADQHFLPMVQTEFGDGEFDIDLEGAGVGGLFVTRLAHGALKLETTHQTIRHPRNKPDTLWFNLKLAGAPTTVGQNGRCGVQAPGDFSVHDPSTPFEILHPGPVEQLIIEVSRDRLEDLLGPARNFSGLTMSGRLPTTKLVGAFLRGLLGVQDRLTPDAAERMASVGLDLIAAGIAERMALETPKPLRGTVTVQRAKAYIEANLAQSTLDPPQVAAAVGVSLRHLQQLFRESGRHVSEWIWQRRLETAARRLTDPACMHLPLGTLAYGCGFTSQAHFSRRFRDRYDLSPGDYRRVAMAGAAGRIAGR